MNTITFILSNTPNPRLQKRAIVLKGSFECNLVSIRRKNADLYKFSPSLYSHICVKDAAVPPSSKIISRAAFQLSIFQWQVEAAVEQKPDILYVQGLDCLMAACFAKRKMKSERLGIVYEVSDIREALFEGKGFFQSVKTRLLSFIERACLRNVNLLVVTSPAFVKARYGDYVGSERTLFIPNAPNLCAFKDYKRKTSGPFTLGYVGVLRYVENLKLAVDAVRKISGMRMILSGGSASSSELETLVGYCEGDRSIEFTGPYDYEKDIADIYGRFDCVWAVYDSANPNVRVALPNKLYESVSCGLPLIVARGTYLAEIVEKAGIGIAVDSNSSESIYSALLLMWERGPRYAEMCNACNRAKDELCDLSALNGLPETLGSLLDISENGSPDE